MSATDKLFSGSIPEIYDTHLVPLIFEPYAANLARQAAEASPARVLETAAGTGVVTRALAGFSIKMLATSPEALQTVTDRAAEAIAKEYGEGPVSGKIQAHVIIAHAS
jgi:hypothetical protein